MQEKNSKKSKQEENNRRSKRTIKMIKTSESYSSENICDYISEDDENQEKTIYQAPHFEDENQDVVMQGSLLYRFALDQIELEGFWSMPNDEKTKERFSYLFLKNCDKLACHVDQDSVEVDNYSDINANQNKRRKDFQINICSANLYETILIHDSNIFDRILAYLTGEYHGFFMYYDKTIEDRFYINFNLQDSQVRINGKYSLNCYR